MKKMKQVVALMTAAVLLAGCSGGTTQQAAPAASTDAAGAASTEAAAADTAVSEAEADAGTADAPAGNRLEEIKARGVMTVATEPYFAPNEFIDPTKTGQDQYVGADIELAKYIAEKMGVELEIVPLEFSAVLASIPEGKYDMAISALAYTPERAEAMNLSDGYHFTVDDYGYGLMINADDADAIKGPEDLADKIIVTQSGSLQEALVNAEVPEYAEFKRVSAMTDAFLTMQEGKADAAAVSVENAMLFIENNPDANLMIVEPFRFNMPPELDGERVAIMKGEDELTDFVNECIAELLADGTYEKWYGEYAAYAAELGVE